MGIIRKKGGKSKSAVRKGFLKDNALYSYKKYVSDQKQFDTTPALAANTWTELKGIANPSTFIGLNSGTTDVTRMNKRVTLTGLMMFCMFDRTPSHEADEHIRILLIKERTRDGNHVTAGDLPKWDDTHGDTGTADLIMAPHSIISAKKYQVLYDKVIKQEEAGDTLHAKMKIWKKKFSYLIPQNYAVADADDDEVQNRVSCWLISHRASTDNNKFNFHWVSYFVDNLA